MPIILLLALLLASTNGHANRAERRHAKVSGFTRRWISILETAEYLNITERTVREMIRDGADRLPQRQDRPPGPGRGPRRHAALRRERGVNTRPNPAVSQQDRDALDDRGLSDVHERADDPKPIHHDETTPT